MRFAGRHRAAGTTLVALLLLGACQQAKPPVPDTGLILSEPPAAGTACAPLAADWLERLPAQQRRILPADCQQVSTTPLFSWGEPNDRLAGTAWSFALRRAGSAVQVSRSDIYEPRLQLTQTLPAGDYEWAVAYTNSRGATSSTQWRRFTIVASPTAQTLSSSSASTAAWSMPDGQTLAQQLLARSRPRMLASGSSYARIKAAALSADHLPVLNALRSRATTALSQAVPASPDSAAAGSLATSSLQQTARAERFRIENLALIGRLDANASMIAAARQRLLALGAWSPTGLSSHSGNVQANREIFLALAEGLDLLWDDLSSSERNGLSLALRSRLLQATQALSVLDRSPYDSIGVATVRWVNQALLLAVGLPGFPEAQSLFARHWELSRFTLGAWGDQDGSFGNGIAYAWYALNSTVPYVAAVRATTGVDLYQLPYLRRAGEQLMAFTAPNLRQSNAYGDELETQDLYAYYSPSYYRLHAQLTRSAQDAWYWQANPANLSKPSDALIWQLLLLGVDASTLPKPEAPSQNDWFFADAGLAALHVDARLSARTSLFFRASRFGAYNHSHADQNSIVYVSQGQPLLVNAGYDPYYGSPHHNNTRSTRYKNALSFDGGYGQSESLSTTGKPADPLHSMDASGTLLRTESRANLAAVTGDATLAYRAYSTQSWSWVPLLGNAVRSVVMDKSSGVTLVYDWATSSTPRQWELNFHSPNPFSANASTVMASKGGASVCLDRYGPATSFAQTQAWEVAPENGLPAQAHGRFTVLSRSTEFAHLTVLRDSCRDAPLQVSQSGSRITVQLGTQRIVFEQRQLSLP